MKLIKWIFSVTMMFIVSAMTQASRGDEPAADGAFDDDAVSSPSSLTGREDAKMLYEQMRLQFPGHASKSEMRQWILSDFTRIDNYHISGLRDIEIKQSNDADITSSFLAGVTEGNDKVTIVEKIFSEPLNLAAGDSEKLFLYFSFFVENAEALAMDGQIELTSSGTSDREELHWNISSAGVGPERIKNGWNIVLLPFSEGGQSGSGFAQDRINYLRIFIFSSRPIVVGYGAMAVLSLDTSGFSEDFSEASSGDLWTAKGASLSLLPNNLSVSSAAHEFLIKTDGYDFSLSQPGDMLLDAKLTIKDKDKLNELALLIGSGNEDQYARYNLPLDEITNGETYHFITKLSDYDQMDIGLTHFYLADTIAIQGSGQTGAILSLDQIGLSPAVETITAMIDNIGEITFSNYLEKMSVVNRAEQLCSTFSTPTKAYISRHIPNYFKLLKYSDKIKIYEAASQSGVLVEYRLDREMIKPGQSVTAFLSISNVGENAVNEINYAFMHDQRITETRGASTGTVSLAPGQSHEVLFELIANEGGVGSASVEVHGKNGQQLKTEKAFFIVDGPGFFFSDCHTHSIESDGKGSLADNLKASFNNGAFIMYATDHNANPSDITDLTQAIANIESADSTPFIAIKGNEITSFVHGAGHMLHYNSHTHYAQPDSQDMAVNTEAYKDIIQSIIKEGGFCYIAHPFLGGRNDDGTYNGWPFIAISDGNIKEFTGYSGIEIMNSFQTPHTYQNVSLPAVVFWDRMNIKGENKYFGISNSDGHHSPHLNSTQNCFLLDSFTENRFTNALGTGRFYGTSGPQMRFTLDGQDMGESVIMVESKSAVAHIEAYDSHPLTKVSLFHYTMNPLDNDASYSAREETVLFEDLNGNTSTSNYEQDVKLALNPQTFYRVEVTSLPSDGKLRIAYSNPVWVTTPAQYLRVDQSEIEMDPGDRIKLNIQTDNIYDSVTLTSSDPDRLKVLDNGLLEAISGVSGKFQVLIENTSGLQAECLVHVKNSDTGG